MAVLQGFATVLLGVFLVWMGSFQMITAMVPRDVGVAFAEKHGAWIREHVLHLPPSDGKAGE